VSSPREAEVAITHGADIIDVRDPGAAFAGVSADDVRGTVAAVARRRPVSAVADESLATVTAMADAGAAYVQVALVRDANLPARIRELSALARRVKLLGVVFANDGFDQELISLIAAAGFAGVLLHTPRQGGQGLLDVVDIPALASFIETARGNGLLAGFAGALEPPDIPRLLLLAPDILGCGGLCTAGSGHPSIDEIRGLISGDTPQSPHEKAEPAKVDYRLLASRAYPSDAQKEEGTDRVFVHDFVLPVSIGTYSRERAKPQEVRFSVDARVLRASHAPEDMRDVFSYDIITDSIRMIVAQDHIPLVEMLAERIAAVVLAHPRVVSATVRVEKLNVGPGSVGVEITRDRPAEPAQVHQLFSAASDRDPKAT
jgi:FolB domain-containing protein